MKIVIQRHILILVLLGRKLFKSNCKIKYEETFNQNKKEQNFMNKLILSK